MGIRLLVAQTRLLLNRPSFTRTLQDKPEDPSRSKFGGSFVALYESAQEIVQLVKQLVIYHPSLVARWCVIIVVHLKADQRDKGGFSGSTPSPLPSACMCSAPIWHELITADRPLPSALPNVPSLLLPFMACPSSAIFRQQRARVVEPRKVYRPSYDSEDAHTKLLSLPLGLMLGQSPRLARYPPLWTIYRISSRWRSFAASPIRRLKNRLLREVTFPG